MLDRSTTIEDQICSPAVPHDAGAERCFGKVNRELQRVQTRARAFLSAPNLRLGLSLRYLGAFASRAQKRNDTKRHALFMTGDRADVRHFLIIRSNMCLTLNFDLIDKSAGDP